MHLLETEIGKIVYALWFWGRRRCGYAHVRQATASFTRQEKAQLWRFGSIMPKWLNDLCRHRYPPRAWRFSRQALYPRTAKPVETIFACLQELPETSVWHLWKLKIYSQTLLGICVPGSPGGGRRSRHNYVGPRTTSGLQPGVAGGIPKSRLVIVVMIDNTPKTSVNTAPRSPPKDKIGTPDEVAIPGTIYGANTCWWPLWVQDSSGLDGSATSSGVPILSLGGLLGAVLTLVFGVLSIITTITSLLLGIPPATPGWSPDVVRGPHVVVPAASATTRTPGTHIPNRVWL